MLTRASLHQTRFVLPGVSRDSRGVLLGREAVLLVSSIDRVTRFFRIFGAQHRLDDLLSGLRILRAQTPLKTQEFLVFFPVQNSQQLDNAARVARVVDGYLCTGSQKHYVAYRDNQSPLGYDVDDLSRAEADTVLYTQNFTQAYKHLSALPFLSLLYRLSLQPSQPTKEIPELLYLRAPHGLIGPLQRYLLRNGVSATLSVFEKQSQSSFETNDTPSYLFRIQKLPARMLRLFCNMPGLTLFAPVLPNVLIALGYAHPLPLETCSSMFSEKKLVLFSPTGVEESSGEVFFSPIFESATLRLDEQPLEILNAQNTPMSFELPLQLVVSAEPISNIRAILLPHTQRDLLGHLIYLLPPTLLPTHKVCATRDHIVIIRTDNSLESISHLPIGTPYREIAPSLFLPLGHRLVPSVSTQNIASLFGQADGRVRFLCHDAPAFSLATEDFVSLDRHVLQQLSFYEAEPLPLQEFDTQALQLINDPVSSFALWGKRLERE